MKPNIKPFRAEAAILWSAGLMLALFALAEWGYCTHGGFSHATTVYRTFLLCVISLQFYLGARLYRERKPESRAVFYALLTAFALYLYLLVTLTLTDASLGRGEQSVYHAAQEARAYYIKHFVNLTPFQTIYTVYIKGFFNGYVNSRYMLLNLVGNTCAFMPFAFFLPRFFRAQKRWYIFLPTVTAIVVAVECLQFAWMVGSCDIDDVILNVGGTAILFAILRIPPLQRALDKLCLL